MINDKVPMGWVMKSIGDKDVCTINPNYSYSKGKVYPFVSMECVGDRFQGIEMFEYRKIDNGGYAKYKKGDIIFSKITPCAENGKIALVERLGRDLGFGSTEFIVLSPSKNVDNKFLYYRVTNSDVHSLAVSLMEGTTGRQRIPSNIFKKRIFISIPRCLNEQKAIASILSKVDEAIKAVKETIKAAEKLKKALMQNLLTGKLRPDGTWRKDKDFYTDERFGKVPKGWEVRQVNAICERRREPFEPTKSKIVYDYIGLEHIVSDKFIINGKGKSDDTLSMKNKFYKGDLLYGKLRPYLNKVYHADFDGICSSECLVLFSEKYIRWLYLNFQQQRFLNFTQSMTAGTQHPRVSWRDISRYLICVPQKTDESDIITDKLLSIEKLLLAKQTKIQTLERLKKALMQNLLTGKVRVNYKDWL